MSIKVFIGVGHGGIDPGSLSYDKKYEEADINLGIAKQVEAELIRHGVITQMSRKTDVRVKMDDVVEACNKFKPDYAIDIHNNAATAPSAKGAETYYSISGGKGQTLAINIQNELVNIGQANRGIKTRVNSSGRNYYQFIRETSAPANIIECGFMTNETDMKNMDEAHEQAKIGTAIAKGILKTVGIAYKEPVVETPVTSNSLYRVQVGAYRNKSNAEALVKQLDAAGFKGAFITEQKG